MISSWAVDNLIKLYMAEYVQYDALFEDLFNALFAFSILVVKSMSVELIYCFIICSLCSLTSLILVEIVKLLSTTVLLFIKKTASLLLISKNFSRSILFICTYPKILSLIIYQPRPFV